MSDYDVGYKKTPLHTRFKKGQSGNPKGRPRKERRAMTERQVREDILGAMEREVTVSIEGKAVKKPFFLVILDQLLIKAVKGDMRAIREAIKLRRELINEHVDAQVSLAKVLEGTDRWLEAEPGAVSEEQLALIEEARRRVHDPYNLK